MLKYSITKKNGLYKVEFYPILIQALTAETFSALSMTLPRELLAMLSKRKRCTPAPFKIWTNINSYWPPVMLPGWSGSGVVTTFPQLKTSLQRELPNKINCHPSVHTIHFPCCHLQGGLRNWMHHLGKSCNWLLRLWCRSDFRHEEQGCSGIN